MYNILFNNYVSIINKSRRRVEMVFVRCGKEKRKYYTLGTFLVINYILGHF